LHSTSILLVSSKLALLSLAPSASTGGPSSPISADQDPLGKVSQVLESLGVRAVQLPSAELNELGGGVRDAVYAVPASFLTLYFLLTTPVFRLVLRRESNLDASEGGPGTGDREAWEQAGGEEQPEGCFEAIFASRECHVRGRSLNSYADALVI